MEVSGDGRLASPGVRFPPPLVYVLPFFASFLLNDRIEFLGECHPQEPSL